MSDIDPLLSKRLALIAEDAPSHETILRAVHIGYRRRVSRRRWLAAVSAAAVVLVVASATTLLTPSRGSTPQVVTPPTTTATVSTDGTVATVGTRATVSPPVLPAGSRLTEFTMPAVESPVSVPPAWVSFDSDGPEVTVSPGYIEVNWVGKEPTAMQTIDISRGTTGTGQYRGYLVTTTKPGLDVYAPGNPTTAVSTPTTINGHAAALLNAPKGSYESTYITPAAQRIEWQLSDKRWIQVWAVGEAVSVLTAFASSITETTVEFPARLTIGLSLKGYTGFNRSGTEYVSQLNGPSLSLCPATTSQTFDNSVCLNAWAEVADGGFLQSLAQGSESDAQVTASTRIVRKGNIQVHVNTGLHAAWTTWGPATIVVSAPSKIALSADELADLAASVQLSPSVQVKDQPNPVVESSLAQQSAEALLTTSG